MFNLYHEWEEELIQEFVRHDDIYYSDDNIFFNKYFLNQTFVDSEGRLYDLESAEDFVVRKFLFFQSNRKKLHFKPQGLSLSLNELRKKLEERVNTLQDESLKKEFSVVLSKATSIRQLINQI